MNPDSISAPELSAWLSDPDKPDPVLLDVRENAEVALCIITGSLHMPMQTIPARLSELDQAATFVCICHHGARSMQVARFLARQGFDHVINLTGGIHAWATQVDGAMATY